MNIVGNCWPAAQGVRSVMFLKFKLLPSGGHLVKHIPDDTDSVNDWNQTIHGQFDYERIKLGVYIKRYLWFRFTFLIYVYSVNTM